jgi:hypothetical protein
MSNNHCPECTKYRKGEFCQKCYFDAKQKLVDQEVTHRDSMDTILAQLEGITTSVSIMDVPFKIKEVVLSIRRRMGLPPKSS